MFLLLVSLAIFSCLFLLLTSLACFSCKLLLLTSSGSLTPSQDYIDGEGPHVSFYVDDLSATWSNVIAITSPCSIADSLVYANPRFKKQARTLEEALDQCIFRVLHVVDPLDPSGVVMRLEHEITSRIKPDGSIYENFPAAV